MSKVSVRGVDLACELDGEGPTVIWGHGLSSSRARERLFPLIDWDAVQGIRLLRYDARGHGESGFTTGANDYAWSELAADQLALADASGIDRYLAAGASMGTGTALHVAVAAPERITALLLVIPPTAWETRRAQVGVWEQMAQTAESGGVEALIEAMAERPPPDPLVDRPGWREAAAAAMRSADSTRMAGVMRGAGAADLPRPEALAALGELPVLIQAWSGDPGHPVSTAERLAELLPGARLSVATTWHELTTWTEEAADFCRLHGG